VLLAARACDIAHPVTGLVTDVDEDVTRRFAEQSRSIGYEGMFVIHPSQVPIANAAFMPGEDEYAWSQEVLEVYVEAEREGRGTARDSSGRMIDFAMLRVAERVSERYKRFRERDARGADV
jgi:citrate lyase subunit beta/citryl-CoA lyase